MRNQEIIKLLYTVHYAPYACVGVVGGAPASVVALKKDKPTILIIGTDYGDKIKITKSKTTALRLLIFQKDGMIDRF